MDCEKFDRVLLDLLYDELDELTRAAAVRHTDHCQRCRADLAQLRVTREGGALALVAAPDGFERRVLAAELAARQGLPWTQRAERWWTIATGYAMRPQLAMAALLMLMIGSSLLLLRPKPGSHASIQVTERGTPGKPMDQVVVPLDQEEAAEDQGHEESTTVEVAPDPTPERARAPEVSRAADQSPGVSPVPGEGATADEAIRRAEDEAFRVAMAAYQSRDLERARSLFDEIVASGGRTAATAELYAALATQAVQGCAQALPRFDSVSAHQANNELGHQAKWYSATCRLRTGEIKRALLDLQGLSSVPSYRARAQQTLKTWAQSGETEVFARDAMLKDPMLTDPMLKDTVLNQAPPGPPPQTLPAPSLDIPQPSATTNIQP